MAKASRISETLPLDNFHAAVKNPKGTAGVSIEDRRNRGVIQIFAKNGKTKAVERALKIKQTPGKTTQQKNFSAIPVSPGQWVLVSQTANSGFAKTIAKKLKGIGYVSEQSDSRVIFRVSGPNARQLMQKGCRLDLHPSVAKAGFCGQTQMAQMGVLIHQVDNKPSFDVLVYSGFAQDFAEWLHHSAVEFGVSVIKS